LDPRACLDHYKEFVYPCLPGALNLPEVS
jgi:hypothetical protein